MAGSVEKPKCCTQGCPFCEELYVGKMCRLCSSKCERKTGKKKCPYCAATSLAEDAHGKALDDQWAYNKGKPIGDFFLVCQTDAQAVLLRSTVDFSYDAYKAACESHLTAIRAYFADNPGALAKRTNCSLCRSELCVCNS